MKLRDKNDLNIWGDQGEVAAFGKVEQREREVSSIF